MIRHKRVQSQDDILFPFAWDLYESSFPQIERRTKDYHIETMGKGAFHADVILEDDEPIGILFWWELSDFRFIEHFATSPIKRGNGYGNKILQEFIDRNNKPILLEVEHPEDEITRRRIGFYQRIGFTLNDHPYNHPSYQQIQGEVVNLMIMTHPKAIDSNELQRFVDLEFPKIHFRNF
ncbi:MAG: GNAT family N-acetyltransferase [Rikenellaceae bacterium]